MFSRLIITTSRSSRVVFCSKPWSTVTVTQPGGFLHVPHCQNSTEASKQSLYETLFNKDSPPIAFAQQVLETGHDITHLPWWANIVATTVALRGTITLPFAVYQQYIMAKLELLQPEMKAYAMRLKKYVVDKQKTQNWTERRSKIFFKIQMKRAITNLYIRDNCHPFKRDLLIWVQLPMWICLSFALRNMSGAFPGKQGQEMGVLVPAMQTEGTLWFPDLTQADPYWILPLLLGISNLLVIEFHALRPVEPTKFQRRVTMFFRCLSVAMVPLAASLPTAMSLYWTTSSIFGLTQNILLKFPKVRRVCGIPKTSHESRTPYKDMYQIAKQKFQKKTRKE
ncbi:cytochrome c oxidase assembly protein COX18, mitochondrial-like [Ptychodera flava]|uniref:cytochrome c oxidase assembly protein COX18, mitochondrial-like n=1 Tax=Ptychodera flava TaxID=63121 RepID=UPI00396A0BA1